ncbi:MAG TPA: TetR/AcrR family transcriptional regulator [Polyangiaceae bacterium]|nr:TetR/AcrR family transcriptional regulator [Polyangiaceae bacterium]
MPKPDNMDDDRADTRERILEAARRLIETEGKDAATTRAVAAAASVQAPTIYRLFGDKFGLLDATAEYALAKYVGEKSAKPPHPDPIEDLRRGWDEHVAFSLSHPALFALMSGDQRTEPSPAAKAGTEVLRRKIHRLAEHGLLRVDEKRAVLLMQAVGVGVVKRLLEQPAHERDPGLSVFARDVVLDALVAKRGAVVTGAVRAAIALKAGLSEVDSLSNGERLLLEELLERIAAPRAKPTSGTSGTSPARERATPEVTSPRPRRRRTR